MDETTEPERPVRERDIPVWTDDEDPEWLPVTIDGHPARIVIASRAWRSEAIGIRFDPPHPEYGEDWGTKHFAFLEPGRLGWGYDGVVWTVLHASAD